MAFEFFQEWNPTEKSGAIVAIADSIISEYQEDGYTLTLRQLYYQFVARDLIENSERSYKNLGTIITKARMAGLLDWEAIEDRNRGHNSFWYKEDPLQVIKRLPNFIRFDRWERQDTYLEVWVEKEALGNVIERACNPYLVPHMACKGYLSSSEAWRAGKRFEQKVQEGKRTVIIHLGDHDPSGIDMTRDNKERVNMFSNLCGDVEVVRVALNMDQVEEFSPPPNPAKITDSRANEYIKMYGRTSWELDALEPQMMVDLIQGEISRYIDDEVWESVGEEERAVESMLSKVYTEWESIKKIVGE